MTTKRVEVDETIQKKRLRLLVDKYGSQREFGAHVGLSPSYVNRLLMPPSSPHHKRLGEPLARKIEARTGRPKYWLRGEGKDDDESAPRWPFYRISFARFDNLLNKEKQFIEAVLEKMISQYESQRQPARKADRRNDGDGHDDGRHRRHAV